MSGTALRTDIKSIKSVFWKKKIADCIIFFRQRGIKKENRLDRRIRKWYNKALMMIGR